MNNRILFIVFFIIVLLNGCSRNDENNAGQSVPVKIFKVRSESISRYVRATGSVEGDEDVILYGKLAERVETVNVVPGQAVGENQILVEQKNDILQQGVEIAEAALKTAESQAQLAAADFDRISMLFTEKAVSQQQYDQAKMSKETADHALDQARSVCMQSKEQFENSFIKAPFNGIVAAVFVEKNQTINIGQRVIHLLSPSKMKAKINISGEEIRFVRTGQRVLMRFPTIPGKEYAGRVSKINRAVDRESKSLGVEIAFLSEDKNIKSGIFGEYLIEIENKPGSLVIPEAALIPQTEVIIDRSTGLQNTLKKYFLFVIQNNTAKLKEVKTGIANDGQIEIAGGIAVGDSVIIVGQNIVREGQNVKVIE